MDELLVPVVISIQALIFWLVLDSTTRTPSFVIRNGIWELFTNALPHSVLILCLNNEKNYISTIWNQRWSHIYLYSHTILSVQDIIDNWIYQLSPHNTAWSPKFWWHQLKAHLLNSWVVDFTCPELLIADLGWFSKISRILMTVDCFSLDNWGKLTAPAYAQPPPG
jgi:hypothetical protein